LLTGPFFLETDMILTQTDINKHASIAFPHLGGCPLCRQLFMCSACGKTMDGTVYLCTNGRCSDCHRTVCGELGSTEPGHGYFRKGAKQHEPPDIIEEEEMESATAYDLRVQAAAHELLATLRDVVARIGKTPVRMDLTEAHALLKRVTGR
jgi:hypothetical protein